MPPIISFIGRQPSDTTTVASQVVSHLNESGYSTAVIKSTGDNKIISDQPGTDTATYQQAGAHAVTLLAQDQMIIQIKKGGHELTPLAYRFFADADIVIAEGFEDDHHIAKIEVSRDGRDLLCNQAKRVIAVVSDHQVACDSVFRRGDSQDLADFIENRFLLKSKPEQTVLFVNGKKVVLNGFIQKILAGTVEGLVDTLKTKEDARNIELCVRIPADKKIDNPLCLLHPMDRLQGFVDI
jgi:molybdopterin-guanine dinucleotide biosynthesis protein B